MLIALLVIAIVIVWLYFMTRKADNGPIAVTSTPADINYAPEQDAWEGSFWEVQQPFPVKATLHLTYEDSRSQRSERIVDVREFGSDGVNNYVIGFCRLRSATRTFRPDRIKECVDVETGEIIADVYAFLRSKYEASPEYSRDKFCEEEYDALRILFYVGKADGQLRAAEKDLILDTCHALAQDNRITTAMLDEIFASLTIPTENAFKSAVRRIEGKDDATRSLIIKSAENIVATQKTIHPAEQSALEYMRKRLLSANTTQEVTA